MRIVFDLRYYFCCLFGTGRERNNVTYKEAYDECTRTTSSIRNASKELLDLVPSDSLAAGSTRLAISKARQLEPSVGALERFLFEMPAALVDPDEIKKVQFVDCSIVTWTINENT